MGLAGEVLRVLLFNGAKHRTQIQASTFDTKLYWLFTQPLFNPARLLAAANWLKCIIQLMQRFVAPIRGNKPNLSIFTRRLCSFSTLSHHLGSFHHRTRKLFHIIGSLICFRTGLANFVGDEFVDFSVILECIQIDAINEIEKSESRYLHAFQSPSICYWAEIVLIKHSRWAF